MSKKLKVLALVLVAVFAVTVFVGCGAKNDPVDGSSAVETQSDITPNTGNGEGEGEGEGEINSDVNGDGNNQVGDTSSITSTTTGTSSRPGPGGPTNPGKTPVNKTGWPIVNEKIKVNVMGIGLPQYGSYKDMSMFKWYEKKSNVEFVFEAIAGGETAINNKKAIVMQSGKYPDMFTFYNNTFSDMELDKYGKEGAFIDVSKLLPEYAPNIAKELNDPVQKAINTMSNGAIYTIPNKNFNDSELTYEHWLNVNKVWLKNVGYPDGWYPKTMVEFREMLKKFAYDANKNGKKDEIPYATYIWADDMIIRNWGVTGGIQLDKNGKALYGRTTENAHQACIYWNSLINQKENGISLIDKELDGSDGNGEFTKFLNAARSGKVGAFTWSYITGWDKSLLDQYVAIPYPTANFNNPQYNLPKARQPFSSSITRGCKIITKNTKNSSRAEALLRYYDYLYTDDGIMLSYWGSPDDGLYTKTGKQYKLTAKAKGVDPAKKCGLSWTMRAPHLTCMEVPLDTGDSSGTAHGKAYLAAANKTYRNAMKADPMPYFPPVIRTSEQIAQMRKFSKFEGGGGHLSRYVEGYLDLAGWTTWVNSEAADVDAYVKLWQKIYDSNKQFWSWSDGDLNYGAW